MSDEQPTIVTLADDAYEAVRAINHATIAGPPRPGPEVYRVLGSLKLLGPALDQALSQLGAGLGRSLERYDVYEDDGADPVQRVAETVDLLTEARQHAAALGRLLEQAQGRLSRQGYRDGTEDLDEVGDPLCGCDAPAEAHGLSFHVTAESRAAAQRRAAELAGE